MIYVHVARMREVMRETRGSMAGFYAIEIIGLLTGGEIVPFHWDEERAAKAFNKHFKNRQRTAQQLRDLRPDLLKFFVELPDGRWMPNPDIFVANAEAI